MACYATGVYCHVRDKYIGSGWSLLEHTGDEKSKLNALSVDTLKVICTDNPKYEKLYKVFKK